MVQLTDDDAIPPSQEFAIFFVERDVCNQKGEFIESSAAGVKDVHVIFTC